jgi:four helix bundle protein
MQIRDHRSLRVWNRAVDLGVQTHNLVEGLALRHQIAYGAQMRRAAVSVGANIAEGAARRHTKEYVQHLAFSRGSVAELHTQYLILGRCNLFEPQQIKLVSDSMDHISRMLTRMIYSLT